MSIKPEVTVDFKETEKQFIVEISNESKETWLNKSFISQELKDALSQANLLILPNEDYRENTGVTFLHGTDELLFFLKENSPNELTPDICIEEQDYQEIALYSELTILGTLLISSVIALVAVNLLSSYIDRKITNQNSDSSIRIELLIESKNKTTRILYQGKASDFTTTVLPTINSLKIEEEELKHLSESKPPAKNLPPKKIDTDNLS